MLDNGKGLMFMPGEDWRRERKMKTHALNQKYNALTEYELEKRKEMSYKRANVSQICLIL